MSSIVGLYSIFINERNTFTLFFIMNFLMYLTILLLIQWNQFSKTNMGIGKKCKTDLLFRVDNYGRSISIPGYTNVINLEYIGVTICLMIIIFGCTVYLPKIDIENMK